MVALWPPEAPTKLVSENSWTTWRIFGSSPLKLSVGCKDFLKSTTSSSFGPNVSLVQILAPFFWVGGRSCDTRCQVLGAKLLGANYRSLHWLDTWSMHMSYQPQLVGGFNPIETYESNWISSPGKGEHKKSLKPPTSQQCTQLHQKSLKINRPKHPECTPDRVGLMVPNIPNPQQYNSTLNPFIRTHKRILRECFPANMGNLMHPQMATWGWWFPS